jgi:hypothetical protein
MVSDAAPNNRKAACGGMRNPRLYLRDLCHKRLDVTSCSSTVRLHKPFSAVTLQSTSVRQDRARTIISAWGQAAVFPAPQLQPQPQS